MIYFFIDLNGVQGREQQIWPAKNKLGMNHV